MLKQLGFVAVGTVIVLGGSGQAQAAQPSTVRGASAEFSTCDGAALWHTCAHTYVSAIERSTAQTDWTLQTQLNVARFYYRVTPQGLVPLVRESGGADTTLRMDGRLSAVSASARVPLTSCGPDGCVERVVDVAATWTATGELVRTSEFGTRHSSRAAVAAVTVGDQEVGEQTAGEIFSARS